MRSPKDKVAIVTGGSRGIGRGIAERLAKDWSAVVIQDAKNSDEAKKVTERATIDLEAYFRRIGYDADRTPTLDTLRAIQLRHAETIAFENLNPLMRWPVPLGLESLQQKLVRDRRGGYCFEQNLLLKHLLTALGFRVTGLAARVLWNEPDGALRPRSHMLLLVELKGTPYLADVGFGILTPTAPLRLEPEIEQATPHEPFRLLPAGRNS